MDDVTKLFYAQTSAAAEEIEQTIGLIGFMPTIRDITETRLAPIFVTVTTKIRGVFEGVS